MCVLYVFDCGCTCDNDKVASRYKDMQHLAQRFK